jgi:hypothetical protein
MKILTTAKYIFLITGLSMLVGGLYWYQGVRIFVREASVAQGTVTDLVRSSSSSSSSNSTTYRPVVQYTTQSGETVEFTSSSGSNPPSYSKGEQVEVLYRPLLPAQAKINSFFSLWGGPVIVGSLGGVFSLLGGGILLLTLMKSRSDEYLKKHGTRIETKFQSVEINTSLKVNGRSPFRVITQWQNPATSELHLFTSNNLWFDPSDHIDGRKITVLIERNNPKKYYMDLSFLPKLAS